jgi:TonB family protein
MNQTEVDDIVQIRIAKLKEEYPGYDFYPVKFSSGKIENGNPFWLLRVVFYENKVGVGQSFPSGNSPMKDRRNIEEVQFNENSNDGNIFTVVEEQPVPEGGMRAFYEYVQKELKYPEQAKNQGIEGRVFVQFVVDRDGSITDVQTIRGIGGGCDEEAVRVIANSPKWVPGKQRGETVKVRMILPITFSIGPKITENGQTVTAREVQAGETERPMPEGGMKAFYDYVQKELKYPEQAKNQGIQGRVYVQFVVDKDGSITDVKTIRGIGGGCDEEAVRLITNSPKWVPGKQQGETIEVTMTLPVTFRLD